MKTHHKAVNALPTTELLRINVNKSDHLLLQRIKFLSDVIHMLSLNTTSCRPRGEKIVLHKGLEKYYRQCIKNNTL